MKDPRDAKATPEQLKKLRARFQKSPKTKMGVVPRVSNTDQRPGNIEALRARFSTGAKPTPDLEPPKPTPPKRKAVHFVSDYPIPDWWLPMIAKRLKAVRKAKGYKSQTMLVEAVKAEVGRLKATAKDGTVAVPSRDTISNWENGKSEPSLTRLIRVATAIRVNPATFFGDVPTEMKKFQPTEHLVRLDIGRNIQAVRLERKMTIPNLVHKTGVSNSTLTKVESGHAVLSLAQLSAVCSVLGAKPEDLLNVP